MCFKMYTQTLLVCLVVLSVGYCKPAQEVHMTAEQSSRLLQHAMLCLAVTGVRPDALIAVRNGKFSDDEKFQKFIHCTMNKSGLINETGHIKILNNLDNIYPKSVGREGIKKALEECDKEEGKTPTETAFKITKCFHKKILFI